MDQRLALDLHPRTFTLLILNNQLTPVKKTQEGIATVLVAVAAYWFVHNYPTTAKFLNDAERDYIHTRLAADSDATHEEAFSWEGVRSALRDPKCWLYGLGFHTMSLPLYTLSLFLVRFSSSKVPIFQVESINSHEEKNLG